MALIHPDDVDALDGYDGVADLHVHTDYSDGEDGVSEVLAWSARARLDVIAITDHDTIHGALIAAELARVRKGVEVVIGEEISSEHGHILGLFITDRVPPGMSASETINAIHLQGGLAIAAHPYWRNATTDHLGRQVGLGDLITELPFDAIEVLNGGITPSMIGANWRAEWVAAGLRHRGVGGSDAHVKEAIGSTHTRFAGISAAELRRSIVSGRTRPGRRPIHPAALGRYAAWSLVRLRSQTADLRAI